MPFTISVENDLAQRLEIEAKLRQISVAELATAILDRAVAPSDHNCRGRNPRRLELIRKSIRQSLTADEQLELDSLQAAFDIEFRDFDAALESQLDFMHSAIQ